MIIYVASNGTNYSEIPTLEIECESVEAFAAEWGLEIVGDQLIAKWGNGEGEDTFTFTIIEN